MAKRVEVAAAVIERPDGRFLLAQRPPGTAYAGYWEFPGGKLEAGESPAHALVRELHEELGIEATGYQRWLTREFDYPHARVRLHFFRVRAWRGELCPLHHTGMAWQTVEHITVSPVLPANGPVFAALALPGVYAITATAQFGVAGQLQRLEAACANGLRLIRVREPALAAAALDAFIHAVVGVARRYGARVLVSGDASLAHRGGADGIHLSAAALMALDVRPAGMLVAASCHNADELAQAVRLGLDFVVLGPVLPTASHPDAAAMGWERFAALSAGCPLPVYALGGQSPALLDTAQAAGAHGVAGIRAFWG